jgi:hypothetical protein
MACGTELHEPDAVLQASDDSGSLRVQLRGSDAAGKHYLLRKATFEVNGTAMVTLSTREPRAAKGKLSTPLPAGAYQVYLRPDYELVELREDGSEQTIVAQLASRQPMRIAVGVRSDHEVALRFRHAGQDIAFGARPGPSGLAASLGSSVDPSASTVLARAQ